MRPALATSLLAVLPLCGLLGTTPAALALPSIPSPEVASQQPATGGAPTETTTPPDLPGPDLSRLEESIREQIQGLQDLIRQLTSQGAEDRRLADAYGALGHLLVYYQMPEAAMESYRAGRRLAPDDARWPYYLGFVAADLGRLEEARQRYLEVLELEPEDVATLIRLGEVELDLNRPGEAGERFRRALELHPDLAAGWYGLGRAEARRGELEAAVEHLERAVELQPEAGLAHYALAQAYRRLGEIEKARAALEKHDTRKVSFPDPRVDRLSDTSVISSLQLVRSMAADREDNPDEKFLSYAMAFLSNIQGSADHLRKELASWPEEDLAGTRLQRARLHYALGGLLINRGQPEEAITHLRAALELEPTLDDARVKLANTLARERRFREAEAELGRVLETDPDNVSARLKRAAVYMALGSWDAAAQDLFLLEERDPNNHEVEGRLAAVLERLGRPEEALVRYQAAARLEPSAERAARAHQQAARLLLRGNAPQQALRELERAVELLPGALEARITLAGLLIRAQRYEEALEHFEGTLEHHPDTLQAHLGRATVLMLLERYGRAAAALEESVAALPGHPAPMLLLARLLSASPDPGVDDGERAAELARRLEAAAPSPRSAEAVALAAAARGRFEEALEWQRKAVERARRSGQSRLAGYLERFLGPYGEGRRWRASGPAELIVLPNES